MGEKLRGEADYRIIAVEPASCPSFTRGQFKYDFCDTGEIEGGDETAQVGAAAGAADDDVRLHSILVKGYLALQSDQALKCKETGEEKTILFGLTGTGYFDMVAYEKYNNGEMTDYIPTDADLAVGFAGLPKVEG
mgnify:CR=1 FL=1